MRPNDVFEFIAKIDAHLATQAEGQVPARKFRLNIIGKSALVLAGIAGTTETVDVDSLAIDGDPPPEAERKIEAALLAEFGRANLRVHGYYLDFVPSAFVFLPQKYEWVPFVKAYHHLEAHFLNPNCVVASKLFSAFSETPRKKDQQDVVASIDQGIAQFKAVVEIADQIFENHSMDARSDRFPAVHAYILELMNNYGKVPLRFRPE